MKPHPNTPANRQALLQWLVANGYGMKPEAFPKKRIVLQQRQNDEATGMRCRLSPSHIAFDKLVPVPKDILPFCRWQKMWKVQSYGFLKDLQIEGGCIIGLKLSRPIAIPAITAGYLK